MAWNREIAERYWNRKSRVQQPKRYEPRWYVVDPETAEFFEKMDGSRVWHMTKKDAMRVSNMAAVVALDERNFNESLNVYYQERLFKQVHWDERNGWIS